MGLTSNIVTPTEFKDVLNQVKSGYNNAIQRQTTNKEISVFEGGGLRRIGKPCGFHYTVDSGHRIGKYLRNKMSIIDLIPCNFSISISQVGNNGDSNQSALKGFLPNIDYTEAITNFQKQCSLYNLPSPTSIAGLRLYVTDDTTSSDTVTNTFQPNSFEGKMNEMMNMGQSLKDAMSSLGAKQKLDDLSQSLKDSVKKLGTSFGVNKDAAGAFGEVLSSIISGRRVSLPEIWQGSNYAPNLSVTTKLVSPYGHPDAIAKFIIEPIMYLLILGGAQTTDGVTFGRPFPLTISAYGMTHTPLGGISNITFRRGGNDTAFNIYNQPLNVDVTIDFKFLYSGFAVYDHNCSQLPNSEETFKDATKTLSSAKSSTQHIGMPTLGQIIHSLRPTPPETFFANDVNKEIATTVSAADNAASMYNMSTGNISYEYDSYLSVKSNIERWLQSGTLKQQYDNVSQNTSPALNSQSFNQNIDNIYTNTNTKNPFK